MPSRIGFISKAAVRSVCVIAVLGVFTSIPGTSIPGTTWAGEPAPIVEDLIDGAFVDQLKSKVVRPLAIETLKAANRKHADLPLDQIEALDRTWRAEREADVQPLITQALASPLSTYLLLVQARSIGLYTEIFVMDAAGLNAGQSAITSDFWQGDEAKFQKTFDVGAGAVFIDEPEIREDVGVWVVQVNFTIDHPDTGVPLGAVTAEVNLTELARRRAAGV